MAAVPGGSLFFVAKFNLLILRARFKSEILLSSADLVLNPQYMMLKMRAASCVAVFLSASLVWADDPSPPTEQPGALDLYPPEITATFPATVDHFRFNTRESFPLKFLSYNSFVEAGNASSAPVLLYCGNEGDIEDFYNNTGGMFEIAEGLGAFVVFVEHRYYGTSLPFGPDQSFTNEGLQLLTIEQALADTAEFITALPGLIGCGGGGGGGIVHSNDDVNAQPDWQGTDRCDVVLFGGSYGGMLAAWHRLKYPHLTVGAIASGAPVDFYPGSGIQKTFFDAFVATFDNAAEGCGTVLNEALDLAANASAADLVAAGAIFCSDDSDDDDDSGDDGNDGGDDDIVEQFLFYAKGATSSLAMIDYPYPCRFIAPMPANPVEAACSQLLAPTSTTTTAASKEQDDGPSSSSSSTDEALLASLVTVVLQYVNSSSDLSCMDVGAELVGHHSLSKKPLAKKKKQAGRVSTEKGGVAREGVIRGVMDAATVAWNYQACTELLLEPLTSDGLGFYPPQGKETAQVASRCEALFGVVPRPFWLPTSFGRGADYALPLSQGGGSLSRVLFVENSKDPWHVGTESLGDGLLPTLGDGSTPTRFLAQGGGHHQDLRFSSPYDAPDVQTARELEREAIEGWLHQRQLQREKQRQRHL